MRCSILLPQFTDPSASLPIWAQFLILGATISTLADIMCVGMAGMVIKAFRRSTRARRVTQCVGGNILIGLGTHLAMQKT